MSAKRRTFADTHDFILTYTHVIIISIVHVQVINVIFVYVCVCVYVYVCMSVRTMFCRVKKLGSRCDGGYCKITQAMVTTPEQK